MVYSTIMQESGRFIRHHVDSMVVRLHLREVRANLETATRQFLRDQVDNTGVGIDYVLIDDFERRIRRSPYFAEDNFSANERNYCNSQGRRAGQSYAARWAGKEAVVKSLKGIPQGNFSDIEIINDEYGAPEVMLHGKAQERADALGVTGFQISLTHAGNIAAAVCIAGKSS